MEPLGTFAQLILLMMVANAISAQLQTRQSRRKE